MKYTKKQVLDAFKKADSKSQVCRTLGLPVNGTGMRHVDSFVEQYGICTDHFDNGNKRRRKWVWIIKECPVCGESFETLQGHPREKQTCSHSCANTWFRSGEDNPNWKEVSDKKHRQICFQHYDEKCVVCGWDKVVDVHHIDENRDNNKPKNLIPLCPNHHKLIHMNEYKDMMQSKIRTKNKF